MFSLLSQPFEVVSEKRSSTEKIRITLRLVGEVQKGDNAYFAVMNIIVRTCLQMMNLIQIKRDYYDAHAPVHVPVRYHFLPSTTCLLYLGTCQE